MSPKNVPLGVSLGGQGQPPSVFDTIATLRAETQRRVASGGGSGLGKHLVRCYLSLRRMGLGRADAIEKVWRVVITAITNQADEAGRGHNKPLDKEHYHR